MAHVYVGGTTMALCHWRHHDGALPLNSTGLGGATVALCPEGCATTAHVYVDCTTVVPRH